MAISHGKSGSIKVTDAGATLRDISADGTSVSFEQNGDVVDVSTFGASAKSYVAGLTDATMTIQGFYDNTALIGSHTVLSGIVGLLKACEYGPQGTTTGLPKITFSAICTKFSPATDIGGAVGFSAEFQVSGTVVYTTMP